MGTKIHTYTGRRVDLIDPDPDTIDILDIAYSLSRQCRFGGHCRPYYTVAQHSLLVCDILWGKATAAENTFELLMQGLLHDAAEAYVIDLPTPLKALLPEYEKIELRIQEAIEIKFGILFWSPTVKVADNIAVLTEIQQLMINFNDWDSIKGVKPDPRKIEALTPVEAERDFLKQFHFLNSHLREGSRG